MGIVFQAEDVQLQRPVALKVMRPDVAADAGTPASASCARPGPPPPQARPRRHHLPGRRGPTASRSWPWSSSTASRWTTGCGRTASADRGRVLRSAGDGRGAGRRPRRRAGPPRHQAGEPLARGAQRAGSRSSTSAWPGPTAGDAAPDPGRDGRRHAGVHGPRAGPRARPWTTAATCSASGASCTGWSPAGCPSRATPPTPCWPPSPPRRPPPVRDLNPDVPPRLAALIDRLLAKDPTGRAASAQAVLDEMTEIEKDLGPPGRNPPPGAGSRPRDPDGRRGRAGRPRHPWRLVAVAAPIGVVLLAVVLLLVWKPFGKNGSDSGPNKGGSAVENKPGPPPATVAAPVDLLKLIDLKRDVRCGTGPGRRAGPACGGRLRRGTRGFA